MNGIVVLALAIYLFFVPDVTTKALIIIAAGIFSVACSIDGLRGRK